MMTELEANHDSIHITYKTVFTIYSLQHSMELSETYFRAGKLSQFWNRVLLDNLLYGDPGRGP